MSYFVSSRCDAQQVLRGPDDFGWIGVAGTLKLLGE
jgi:hypothetical protein